MERTTARDFAPIWANYFFFFASFAAVVPYLQLFFAAMGFPPSEIGVLLGTFEVAGMLGPLVIGHVADRTGAFRAILLGAIGVSLLSFNLLGVAPLFYLALPLAFVTGFAYKSAIPLIDAHASSLMVSPEHDYGRARILGSIGFIVSSAFFQFTGVLSEQSGGAIIIAISVLLALYAAVIFLMPPRPEQHDSTRGEPREAAVGHSAGPLSSFDTAFWLFIGIVFIARVGIAAYYSFFSLYLEEAVGGNLVSGMWAIGAAAEIPVILFSGRLIRRFGILSMLVTGFAAVTLRLLIYAAFPIPGVVALTQLLHACTFGLLHSASIAYINRRIPARRRGTGMAIYSSVSLGLSIFVGSSLGGFVVEAVGFDGLFLAYSAIPVVAIALLFGFSSRLKLTP
jgi:PPP family 3-phenylpropionic acid transporter